MGTYAYDATPINRNVYPQKLVMRFNLIPATTLFIKTAQDVKQDTPVANSGWIYSALIR